MFGSDCIQECHCLSKTEKCNKISGLCVSGCAAGWVGSSCDQGEFPCFEYLGSCITFFLLQVPVSHCHFLFILVCELIQVTGILSVSLHSGTSEPLCYFLFILVCELIQVTGIFVSFFIFRCQWAIESFS